jgi:hypothetical protein
MPSPGGAARKAATRRAARLQAQLPNIGDKFLRHTSTGVVQYIDPHGWPYKRASLFDGRPSAAMLDRMRELSSADVVSLMLAPFRPPPPAHARRDTGRRPKARPDTRLRLSQASGIAEQLSLEAITRGDLTRAARLLWHGIAADTELKQRTRNPPSYRLYDLLGCVLTKANDVEGMTRLRTFASTAWRTDPTLQARVAEAHKARWSGKWKGDRLRWGRREWGPPGGTTG